MANAVKAQAVVRERVAAFERDAARAPLWAEVFAAVQAEFCARLGKGAGGGAPASAELTEQQVLQVQYNAVKAMEVELCVRAPAARQPQRRRPHPPLLFSHAHDDATRTRTRRAHTHTTRAGARRGRTSWRRPRPWRTRRRTPSSPGQPWSSAPPARSRAWAAWGPWAHPRCRPLPRPRPPWRKSEAEGRGRGNYFGRERERERERERGKREERGEPRAPSAASSLLASTQ